MPKNETADQLAKALFEAVKANETEGAQKLLASGVNPNYREYGKTLLYWAAKNRNADLISLLLKHALDPTIENRYQDSFDNYGRVLTQAVREDWGIAVCEALLNAGANPNIKGYENGLDRCSQYGEFTPLHHAVENGNAELIKLLMKHGATTTRSAKWHTPMYYAPNAEIVLLITQNSATTNNTRKDYGFMLTKAVKGWGEAANQLIEPLIKAGADTTQTIDYKPPLFWAVKNDNAQHLELLMRNGVSTQNTYEPEWNIGKETVTEYATRLERWDILSTMAKVNEELEEERRKIEAERRAEQAQRDEERRKVEAERRAEQAKQDEERRKVAAEYRAEQAKRNEEQRKVEAERRAEQAKRDEERRKVEAKRRAQEALLEAQRRAERCSLINIYKLDPAWQDPVVEEDTSAIQEEIASDDGYETVVSDAEALEALEENLVDEKAIADALEKFGTEFQRLSIDPGLVEKVLMRYPNIQIDTLFENCRAFLSHRVSHAPQPDRLPRQITMPWQLILLSGYSPAINHFVAECMFTSFCRVSEHSEENISNAKVQENLDTLFQQMNAFEEGGQDPAKAFADFFESYNLLLSNVVKTSANTASTLLKNLESDAGRYRDNFGADILHYLAWGQHYHALLCYFAIRLRSSFEWMNLVIHPYTLIDRYYKHYKNEEQRLKQYVAPTDNDNHTIRHFAAFNSQGLSGVNILDLQLNALINQTKPEHDDNHSTYGQVAMTWADAFNSHLRQASRAGDTVPHFLAETGDIQAFENYFQRSLGSLDTGKTNEGALNYGMWFSTGGHVDLLKRFLKVHPKLKNARDSKGFNYGHRMARYGHALALIDWLEENPTAKEQVTHKGEHYIHLLAQWGDLDAVSVFLEKMPEAISKTYSLTTLSRAEGTPGTCFLLGSQPENHIMYYATYLADRPFHPVNNQHLKYSIETHATLTQEKALALWEEMVAERAKALAEVVRPGQDPAWETYFDELTHYAKQGHPIAISHYQTCVAAHAERHMNKLFERVNFGDATQITAKNNKHLAKLEKYARQTHPNLVSETAKSVLQNFRSLYATDLRVKACDPQNPSEQALNLLRQFAEETQEGKIELSRYDREILGRHSDGRVEHTYTPIERRASFAFFGQAKQHWKERREAARAPTPEKCVNRLRKALQEGATIAYLELGRCYEKGLGVKADPSHALYQFYLGQAAGCDYAADALKKRHHYGDTSLACLALLYSGLVEKNKYYIEQAQADYPRDFDRHVLQLIKNDDLSIFGRLSLLDVLCSKHQAVSSTSASADLEQSAYGFRELLLFLSEKIEALYAKPSAPSDQEKAAFIANVRNSLNAANFTACALKIEEDHMDMAFDIRCAFIVAANALPDLDEVTRDKIKSRLAPFKASLKTHWQNLLDACIPQASDQETVADDKDIAALEQMRAEIHKTVEAEIQCLKSAELSLGRVREILTYAKNPLLGRDDPSRVEAINQLEADVLEAGSQFYRYLSHPESLYVQIKDYQHEAARAHYLACLDDAIGVVTEELEAAEARAAAEPLVNLNGM